MPSVFQSIVATRRSHRDTILPESTVFDSELEDLVKFALDNSPSYFNSQGSRAILVVKEDHQKLWDAAKESAKAVQSGEYLEGTLAKIDGWRNGYGTILIYDDEENLKGFQAKIPPLAEIFVEHQAHSSGILQFVLWTSLSEKGLGGSLQHQQALVQDYAKQAFGVADSWKLVAQIPFGKIKEGTVLPDRVNAPIETRFKAVGTSKEDPKTFLKTITTTTKTVKAADGSVVSTETTTKTELKPKLV
ncbi:hypothetical protein HK100_010868 [Physocladia obscura]|uniref:Nitroreductase domain-containing protein n=1 Tax=Physocladia obscura TaxID=109957 RepID=A0AAD5T4N6_9FUNG|nr:hypothetical protein HK100_010868 [Physocladia obscura]